VDHGGIACALASNWIALEAAAGEGMLWNKRGFGADVSVAFNIEENSEWFGWHAQPSHVHNAWRTIRVVLASPASRNTNYTLALNAQEPGLTTLRRNGVVVDRFAAGRAFPVYYRGGHAPFVPRRSRLAVIKLGAELTVVLNGVKVLSFNDPAPLAVGSIGIGAERSRVNFSRIEVRELVRGL
jgi:hypothetical protein